MQPSFPPSSTSPAAAPPPGGRLLAPPRRRLRAHTRALAVAFVALFVVSLATPSGQAAELELAIANDPVTGSSQPDDLYTSDLSLGLRFDHFQLVLGERMFTDRERSLRFDETHLSARFALPAFAGWSAVGAAGVLQVGEGLLGQRVQNAVHRAIGSDELALPYVDDELHPTFAVTLARPLATPGPAVARAEVTADLVPGLRSTLGAQLVAERALGGSRAVRAALGVRADHVEHQALAPRVASLGPTAEVGLAWRSLTLRARWNAYGTRSTHLALGLSTRTNLRFVAP
jgi:hypothetical protein